MTDDELRKEFEKSKSELDMLKKEESEAFKADDLKRLKRFIKIFDGFVK